MARQTGIIQLSGPLGGISFYRHKKYGMLARACNPVSAERIAKDPAFARTRENGTEFGMASRAGKLLRDGLHRFLQDVPTEEFDLRVMRLMMDLKAQDTVSARGQRQVGIALGLKPELLGGFALSRYRPERFVVRLPVTDRQARTITLRDFIPDHVPEQATHVVVTGFQGRIDFGKGERDFVFSTAVELSIETTLRGGEGVSIPIESPVATTAVAPIVNRGAATLRGVSPFYIAGRDRQLLPSGDVVLRLPELPAVADALPGSSGRLTPRGPETGIELWGVKIVFLQEVNGVKYPLHVGAAGVLESHAVVASDETTLHGGPTVSVADIPEGILLRDVPAPIVHRSASSIPERSRNTS
jgi:hypothetical protein